MRPPHKGKQEERQAGKYDGRQDFGEADTPSNTKAENAKKNTRHKEKQAGSHAGR